MSEKLRNAVLPPTKPKAKPKKLGLRTNKLRQGITFRFRHNTIERLEGLLDSGRRNISHKLSRTDLIEAFVFWAAGQEINNIKGVVRAWDEQNTEGKNI